MLFQPRMLRPLAPSDFGWGLLLLVKSVRKGQGLALAKVALL